MLTFRDGTIEQSPDLPTLQKGNYTSAAVGMGFWLK
ncbi:hypothetical protein FHS56_000808 [Thermonema lapsum]|uniref:Uncharacterized protein n=1 Tax=Thermonema lapsum TaxID=28195 RepID=A0A846MPK1_9BACT|nr:hypothetical protein [Thermonema lapsum]